MNLHRMMSGIVVAVGLLACLSSCAWAAPKHPHFRITAHKADAIVLKRFPHGKIVEKTKLENEEGVWQFGVMVRNGKTLREVMVNAKTGHIDNVEVTNTAKERTEAKADATAGKTTRASVAAKGEKGEKGEAGESREAPEKGKHGEKE